MGEFYQLLLSAIQSCSQVILLCLGGYIAAVLGIINSSLQKGLSSLIIKIFMPCLLFSNIAADIDLETLIRLWPIPALYITFVITSTLLGGVGGNLLKLSSSNTKFLMTGIIFNNVTSLGLGLLEGIESTQSIEILLRDDNDSPREAVKRGMSYVLLSTLLGNLARWSFGTYLLKKDDSVEEVSNTNSSSGRSTLPVYSHEEQVFISERSPLIVKSIEKRNSMRAKVINLVYKWFKAINGIMNPPLYAAFLALIVGTVPFLKGIFFGVDAPLYPTITRTTEHLGKISVPLTLLTLGAQLKNLPRVGVKEMFPQISFIMLSRFLIMPVIGITLIAYTKDYFIDDPMFWFVLMLMASGPPAVNCMNMTAFTGTFQEEMATLLFYSYVAVGPLMAIAVIVMLNVIEKAK